MRNHRGRLRFLDPSVPSSLRRNGRVRTRRDPDGSDGDWEGATSVERTLDVLDARRHRCELEANGFSLVDRPRRAVDFFDHAVVVRSYYPDCVDLVRQATGAATVVAFDHNVRSAQGKASQHRIRGGQQVQGPAHMVHGDYTLTSAPERLGQLARPPRGNDTLASVLEAGATPLDPHLVERAQRGELRFQIVNVWRNIVEEPVVTHPLALCDGQTVQPEDLVVFEIHYPDRIGENYFAKPADRHRFYVYPSMTRDEALLIKQWDSAGRLARTEGAEADRPDEPCTFSFHTAFDDLATPPDAPDRWSIEVRCAVVHGA